MIKHILSLAAPAMILAAAPASAVVTYTSMLEYKDTGGSSPTKAGPFGQVVLEQTDANDIKVTVSLFAPEVGFLNTGGPHEPFLFNLTGDYAVTVTNTGTQDFTVSPYDSDTTAGTNYSATPFGNFTNKIGCCNDKNGGANADPPPLIFNVHDTNGITFAGIGATFDGTTGKLLTMGTGDHFLSNSGGWWFTADLVDSSGKTFNVAARDAFRSPVPEPSTWALMIVVFGVVGFGLRRQRTRVVPDLA